MRQYYIYIMASVSGVLYTGVTNNLPSRVTQHKTKSVKGFTARYNINQLVYYETTESIQTAIQREKQIKGWSRARRVELINSMNPEWRDLSLDFMDPPVCHSEEHDDEESSNQHALSFRGAQRRRI
jgi:putative endonuclease